MMRQSPKPLSRWQDEENPHLVPGLKSMYPGVLRFYQAGIGSHRYWVGAPTEYWAFGMESSPFG